MIPGPANRTRLLRESHTPGVRVPVRKLRRSEQGGNLRDDTPSDGAVCEAP